MNKPEDNLSPVASILLRNEGDVLLFRRSEDVGSYPNRWGVVAGHIEEDRPEAAARREIREETGLESDSLRLVRQGQSFSVPGEDLEVTWEVHPFLFETETRVITTNWETDRAEWTSPTAILDRETVPDLWGSYDHVRPTVETIESDTNHGSATLSIRALEVLRDEAAIASHRDGEYSHVVESARELLDARPAMAVVANRINRVMASAEATPDAVSARAHEEIRRSVRADEEAALEASEFVDGARVATLSRSGTVLRAITGGDSGNTPAGVLIGESRPGREGVGVAAEISSDLDDVGVIVCTDAAFLGELGRWEADVFMVGADSILPDGSVVNKVGTCGSAMVASVLDIPVIVVAASGKISSTVEFDSEPRDVAEVYAGEANLQVLNDTFERTPAEYVDYVITERGRLDQEAIETVAGEHASWTSWD